MNTVVKASLLGVGGLVLFGGAFVGFAKARGADMHALPLIGAMFAAPPEPEPIKDTPPAADTHAASTAAANPAPAAQAHEETHVRTARAGLLDVFSLDAPFQKDELEQLVESLKKSQHDALDRLDAIAAREKVLDEREKLLDERQATLEKLKAQLDSKAREQSALDASTEDPAARAARIQETWVTRGLLFAEGETDRLVERLQGFSASDAAHILTTLDPARARELLDALPAAKWREYAEAYSILMAAKPAQQD
jgi:flagellar motility protein MotE (MotC chaperone)